MAADCAFSWPPARAFATLTRTHALQLSPAPHFSIDRARIDASQPAHPKATTGHGGRMFFASSSHAPRCPRRPVSFLRPRTPPPAIAARGQAHPLLNIAAGRAVERAAGRGMGGLGGGRSSTTSSSSSEERSRRSWPFRWPGWRAGRARWGGGARGGQLMSSRQHPAGVWVATHHLRLRVSFCWRGLLPSFRPSHTQRTFRKRRPSLQHSIDTDPIPIHTTHTHHPNRATQ